VITIQRFFRKRKMQQWLRDNQLQGSGKDMHRVDVSFLEPRTERNNVEC
jgi:hypothetical protein